MRRSSASSLGGPRRSRACSTELGLFGEQVRAVGQLADHVEDVPQAVAKLDLIRAAPEPRHVSIRILEQTRRVPELPCRTARLLFIERCPVVAEVDASIDAETASNDALGHAFWVRAPDDDAQSREEPGCLTRLEAIGGQGLEHDRSAVIA